MTLVTCRLTAKNRDQLRNPTLVIYLFIMTSYTVVQYKNTKAKTWHDDLQSAHSREGVIHSVYTYIYTDYNL